MISALVSVAICVSGWASQYAPAVMPAVVRTRQYMHQLSEHLPRHSGYIAVRNCGHIGEVWTVNDESMVVADCAGDDATRRWMDRGNILVELDYQTAARWGTVGFGKQVQVCQRRLVRERT